MLSFMYAHPGKKLLFMGAEIAQFSEWNYQQSLDWHLLEYAPHMGILNLMRRLNHLYRTEPALYQNDTEVEGFEWIDENDYLANVISFIRKGDEKHEAVIVVCNFSDKTHKNYLLGVPEKGSYKEIFNSQSAEFEGWGIGNMEPLHTEEIAQHGRKQRLQVTLPPLGVVFLKKAD